MAGALKKVLPLLLIVFIGYYMFNDPNGLAQFAETLRQISDPVIAMYAGVEAVAPRPADRIVPLL